jgi:hypothetical protein
VAKTNFSSGLSLVLHILKPYDLGFDPKKILKNAKCLVVPLESQI